MSTVGIAGLIAAYVALAVLLLSLHLYSAWHWSIKLAATLVLAAFYLREYAKQGADLADDVISKQNHLSADDNYLKPLSYNLLGQAYYLNDQYLESQEAFERPTGNPAIFITRKV